MIAGLVLAGGRSSRFGTDKSMAVLQGRPMIAWSHGVLSDCAAVAVSARPGTAAAAYAMGHGLPVLHDAVGDGAGPLSGIRAGLLWARDAGFAAMAVVPCDMPLLPPDLVARLEAGRGDAPACYAVTPDWPQPLCAIWHVDALAVLTAALGQDRHPTVRAVLGAVGAATVAFSDRQAFCNFNTRAEFEAALGRAA